MSIPRLGSNSLNSTGDHSSCFLKPPTHGTGLFPRASDRFTVDPLNFRELSDLFAEFRVCMELLVCLSRAGKIGARFARVSSFEPPR